MSNHNENTCYYCVEQNKKIEILKKQAGELEAKLNFAKDPDEIKELSEQLKALQKKIIYAEYDLDRHQGAAENAN
jgi:hypothetical protein